MRIQHNIMAMNAYRNYNTNTSALSKNLEKLSSGYKINRAGDDAAGLAISEKMRAQITGLNAAQKNVKDGISLVKTAEGAMQEIQDMLNRMDYLATQSANGTYDNEVDRLNLQKEVNQLRSEINRISDSSNFNGIKLLDGKLGLNTDAFTIGTADAVEATDGKLDIGDYVAKEADGSPKVHMETASATAQAPSAVIDLGDLAVKGVAKAADATTPSTASVVISVLGKDYTVTLENTSTTATKDFNATEIAAKLVEQIATYDKGTGAVNTSTPPVNDAMDIGGGAFEVKAATNTITLTYLGTHTGTDAVTSDTSFAQGTSTLATAINNGLGGDVVVKTVTGGTREGDVVHKATQVDHAKAPVVAGKAGIDLTMSTDFVKQGGTLKIDGQTFTFELEDATKTGANVINLAGVADADLLHTAADLLSKKTVTGQDGRSWKIGVNGDGTTIHIEQSVASTTGKELKTYNDVASKISVAIPATAAKNIGTSIKITETAIKEGDMLTIGDKTFFFSDKANPVLPEGATKIAKTGAAAALKNALGSNAELDPNDSSTLIVRAAKEGEMAPAVVGKGLQLQIGDTADSYNQLQVKIGDMHTVALGIDKLSISDPESAAKAISTIRNAINYVSGIRGDLGATQNRLEHTANNLSVMAENIQDAESTIRDTDVAEEMMAYTKNNILVQSAQAMLAQANQVPQGVLQLLG